MKGLFISCAYVSLALSIVLIHLKKFPYIIWHEPFVGMCTANIFYLWLTIFALSIVYFESVNLINDLLKCPGWKPFSGSQRTLKDPLGCGELVEKDEEFIGWCQSDSCMDKGQHLNWKTLLRILARGTSSRMEKNQFLLQSSREPVGKHKAIYLERPNPPAPFQVER